MQKPFGRALNKFSKFFATCIPFDNVTYSDMFFYCQVLILQIHARIVVNDPVMKRLFTAWMLQEGHSYCNSAAGHNLDTLKRFFCPRARL